MSSDREKGAYLEKDDLGKVTLAGQSPCGGVPITLKNIKSVKVSFPFEINDSLKYIPAKCLA